MMGDKFLNDFTFIFTMLKVTSQIVGLTQLLTLPFSLSLSLSLSLLDILIWFY